MSHSSLVRVCSWNVLADCYSRGLVHVTPELTFWETRSVEIRKWLNRCPADIICLQEADHYVDFYEPLFKELDYDSVYLQRPQREDGCLIAYKKPKFEFINKEDVFLDDLAEFVTSVHLRESFLKQNVALIVHLRDLASNQEVIVSTIHVYWNPMKPEVKSAQCKYLLERMEQFVAFKRRDVSRPAAVIVTGDFNALPYSDPYAIISKYRRRYLGNEVVQGIAVVDKDQYNKKLGLHATEMTGMLYGEDTKFICDHTLVRLCRWMRALGIDAALDEQTVPVSKSRPPSVPAPAAVVSDTSGVPPPKVPVTKKVNSKDYTNLFNRARKEKRVILTVSKLMKNRANCPQCFFISSNRINKLESVLADICVEFGLQVMRI
jgi:endonuclease/exonuclease/phosphatase family metal-dependent hydrolase